MSDISKKSKKIKVKLPFKLKESIKLNDDGTVNWDAMDPKERADFEAFLKDYFRAERAEFSMAADDGEDLYDLENGNYHNPHDDDENWDLNDDNEELLTDFREIPDSEDYEEAIYESLDNRKPVTFKEYTHWNEYGDGYSKRYSDFDDEGDDLYEEDDFDDTDEYVDGLDFYDDAPLESEGLYEDDDVDIEEVEDDSRPDGSEIDDSAVVYPEDYDEEQPEFYEYPDTGRQWYERKVSRPFQGKHLNEVKKPHYTSAEVLMYFETKEERDKAFSILLDHDELVYKCDAHYLPAFPGAEKKQAVDRAVVIYADLYGQYDIVSKDNFGKDKAGEDVVVPVRHTKYVEMDQEVEEFVEDMASLLPFDVVDYDYRGVLDEAKKMINRLREGGDIAYVLDGESLKDSGIYDKLAEVYGQKIADIFLDWVNSPEYKNGRFVITYEWGPESATISVADLMDFDMAPYYAELFSELKGLAGIEFHNTSFGSFMSKQYMDRALTRIENTEDDVRFMGKSGPINHLNGDVDMFRDDEI